FSGKDYFKLFSFPLKSGSPQQVLQDKKGIVISESMALKLFDRIDVVGETVSWNLLHVNGEATVTGVFEDLPHNTTEEFDFILPFEQFAQILGSDMNWGNYNAYTYVRLAPNTNVEALNKKLKDFVKRKREGSNVNVFVTKYADYYLYDKYENGKQAGGRILYVKLFSAIGIFILIIASINFMNLTTAKASRRLKEIGVKKSMGASRTSLITQFMTESIFISLIALILATQVVFLVLPAFNGLTGKHLALMLNSDLVLSFLAIALITGLLAGSYPAFYLSGFKPVRILKGKLTSTFGEAWIRKGLVIFQFTLSIIMIVSVIVVYKQIDYIQNKNLGYDRENVITVPIEGEAVKKLDTFLKEISSLPGVVNASATSHTFIKTTASTTGVDWPGKDPDISVLFEQARAHYGLTKTLGIEFIEGRGFSRDYKNEDSKIIFNEAAIEVMGLKDPIGKKVVMWGDEKEIIGVVKNFNYASLHHEVKPMLLHFNTEFLPVAMIRIKSGNIGEAIDQMESFYQSFNPGYTFDYEFMDKSYRAQYQAESQISTLSQVFAVIAILISCLGLFGLATYTAERRQKEIGIRKVLGAGNVRIVTLLSNDFTKMVVIAILLAIPASYYFSTQWLDGYAYRIALKYEYFIVASVLSLSIAWLTVSYQILRAASINPVESLKDE
ncbi:MAG: FtsX-like permease family protein, partial [Fulvivirga sp.]|nr:FtsX-like permease family protein [Fulvivirga sp.]